MGVGHEVMLRKKNVPQSLWRVAAVIETKSGKDSVIWVVMVMLEGARVTVKLSERTEVNLMKSYPQESTRNRPGECAASVLTEAPK